MSGDKARVRGHGLYGRKNQKLKIKNQNDRIKFKNNFYILTCILAFLFLIFDFFNLAHASVTVSAVLDKKDALIGDRIIYTLYVTADKDTELELPLDRPDFTPFDFIGQQGIERSESQGRLTYKIEYVLAAYAVGELETPPQTVYFKDKSGKAGEVSTERLKVKVKGIVPKGKKEIMPEKGPVEVEIKGNNDVWALAVISLVMAVIILSAFICMKKAIQEKITQRPVLTSKDIALLELDRIEGLGLIERGDFKRFHAMIGDCLKRFVSDGVQAATSGLTTLELSERVQGFKDSRLNEVLSDCDLVKFAGYKPTVEEAKTLIQTAKKALISD